MTRKGKIIVNSLAFAVLLFSTMLLANLFYRTNLEMGYRGLPMESAIQKMCFDKRVQHFEIKLPRQTYEEMESKVISGCLKQHLVGPAEGPTSQIMLMIYEGKNPLSPSAIPMSFYKTQILLYYNGEEFVKSERKLLSPL